MFRRLDSSLSVAPQIAASDVAEAARQGFVMVVNNRPDGEAPEAPQGAEIAAAVEAAGLAYRAIPVGHGGFSAAQFDAMASALAEANGPVLAYCRSGTRSTLLWALTRARGGDDQAELTAKAHQAGYDLTPVAAMMDMVAP